MSFTVDTTAKDINNFINLAQYSNAVKSITMSANVTYGGYPNTGDYYGGINVKVPGGHIGTLQFYKQITEGTITLKESLDVSSSFSAALSMGLTSPAGNGSTVSSKMFIEQGVFTSAGPQGAQGINKSVSAGSQAIVHGTITNNAPKGTLSKLYEPHEDWWISYSEAIANTCHVGSFKPGDVVNLSIAAGYGCTLTINSFTLTVVYKDGSSVTRTITDLPLEPTFLTVSSTSVNETAGVAHVTVTRSGNLSYPTDLVYTTRDGTAIKGSDYTYVSGTINFPVGTLTQTIDIPIISTPFDIEGSEYFYIDMYSNNTSTTVTQGATVTINSEVTTQTGIFDLRRDNIHQLSFPAGDSPSDPGTGQKYTGGSGQGSVITIHGGCNAKGGYYIYLDPRPPRVGFDTVPGDETGWRHVYSDGSTRVFMKEYLTEDEPQGHYEVKVDTANSDGTWSSTEFSEPSIGTALQGSGTKELRIGKDNGTVSVGVGSMTPVSKPSGGDGAGMFENETVFIACPGPPHCVDQGFLGYIKGVTAEGWTDPSKPPSGGGGNTTIDITPEAPGTPITPDVIDTVVFDTYRLIGKTVNAIVTEFTWDTKRVISKTVEVPEDGERDIVHVDEVVFDTFRLMGKTINLIKVEFVWDTARIISAPDEITTDTKLIISVDDVVSLDTKRSIIGTINESIFDTKRTIKTSDGTVTTYTVGFDTKRTIIGEPYTEIVFDTKRTIEAPPKGLPDYVKVFDTKRVIENNAAPTFALDTKRIIKKPVTIYFDTKRNPKTSMKQTVIFDTKRRKVVTFWETPEYDDYYS